jgi:thiol-disulfide isomerase/thioredoxin
VAIAFIQGPVILENFKHEGVVLKSIPVTDIQSNQKYFYPAPTRSMIIFWATWCQPCKAEMYRLKKAVESGDIKSEQLFAVNPFEDIVTIKNFLIENPYPFQFIDDAGVISKALGVRGTPTIALLNGQKVNHLSTGMSLIGIFRAQWFLDSTD